MSKKNITLYVCQSCGAQHSKWLGRCPSCQTWDSLVEERANPRSSGGHNIAGQRSVPKKLSEVSTEDNPRFGTSMPEVDRVLGGGIVPGSVMLVGGDPGVGKSTLLLQLMLRAADAGRSALYISGEESEGQVALRAQRLGLKPDGSLMVSSTGVLEDAIAAMHEHRPQIVVLDSVQTFRAEGLESAAGTVAQLREVAQRVVECAKTRNIATFLVGHVTKDGNIAGPKVLEHLVDVVLSFEGDRDTSLRLLRANKNRFGTTDELAIFEMVQDGLREVTDPSGIMLKERSTTAAGSVVFPASEGSRSLLLEVQALVAPCSGGNPRRTTTGLDSGRLSILLAVLDRKAGIHILDYDVFASVAGGASIHERAVDLALCAAVVSAFRNKPVDHKTLVCGEIGLTGEVRSIPRLLSRLSEASRLGFTRAIVPHFAKDAQAKETHAMLDIEVVGVRSVSEALDALF